MLFMKHLFLKRKFLLSTASTSNVTSESSIEISDLPVKKMPNESKLLKLFVKLDKTIGELQTKTNQTLLKDRSRALIFDDQDELRQFYKKGYVVPTSRVIATDSVIVATSGYVVSAAYDISPGRVKLNYSRISLVRLILSDRHEK
ncbi:hypothetical protein Tco_1304022 [Tanacetum coccineum]